MKPSTPNPFKTLTLWALGALLCANASATIVDEWNDVKAAPAPVLKPVVVDTKTTALLVFDMVKTTCNMQRRPRCVASIPAVAQLLENARSRGMVVIHTVAGAATVADILPEFAPKAGEPLLTGTVADKFARTDLEALLKSKGVTTVIPVGTAAHGAILWSSGAAATRGFKVQVPVDAASSENTYAEQATAWMLGNSPTIAPHVTLTKLGLLSF